MYNLEQNIAGNKNSNSAIKDLKATYEHHSYFIDSIMQCFV